MEQIVEYMHMHERGLVKRIAEKHHETITQVRHKLMEKAVETVHLVIREVFGEKWYKIPGILRLELWIYALKQVLPYYWALVHEKQDYVSPEEVIRKLPRSIAEKLRDMYHALMKVEKVLLEV